MDWIARIDWPVSVAVAAVATIAINAAIFAIRRVRARDMYEFGFDCGLHAAIARLVKLRYHKEYDLCVAVVPESEYKKEKDQYL